jgi:glucose-6-phosphate isomerase
VDPSRPVTVGGLVLSLTWAILIKSYRDLNAAKFHVITRMEEQLPVKVYGDEWKKLKEDSKTLRGRYAEFTAIEWIIPLILAGLYFMLLLSPPSM